MFGVGVSYSSSFFFFSVSIPCHLPLLSLALRSYRAANGFWILAPKPFSMVRKMYGESTNCLSPLKVPWDGFSKMGNWVSGSCVVC